MSTKVTTKGKTQHFPTDKDTRCEQNMEQHKLMLKKKAKRTTVLFLSLPVFDVVYKCASKKFKFGKKSQNLVLTILIEIDYQNFKNHNHFRVIIPKIIIILELKLPGFIELSPLCP